MNKYKLKIPLKEEDTRKLKVGDTVQLTGTIFTARDAMHKYLIEEKPNEFKNLLENSVIYHCGPIVKKEGPEWKIISAGPTTSIREEPFEAKLIKEYKIKAIIGKGGMEEKTQVALKKFGCVYLSAVGGTAAILANSIERIKNVYLLEKFGIPEALWEFEVKDFSSIVSMDSLGNSLHKEIFNKSKKEYTELLGG